ncbi:MAG: hypothetical protein IT185_08280 [Acidobacteria bacterium]|nr:hypothetical protein [Acidobacteriota bacterium]
MHIKSLTLIATLALGSAACGGGQPAPAQPQNQAAGFLSAVAAMCGNAYEGRIAANEPATPNDPFVGQTLVMHVRTCEPEKVLVPFHVGEDRSRTWVLTLHGDRLRLKHDHRHQDGTEDELTQYGGDTTMPGTVARQEFPVDQFSKDLFTRTNRTVSNTNTWAMEVFPGKMFAYELARPGRLFRVEFDLTKTVPLPPAPWGH